MAEDAPANKENQEGAAPEGGAEGGDAAQAEAAAAATKAKKKRVLMIISALVAVVGVAVAVGVVFFMGGDKGAPAEGEAAAGGHGESPADNVAMFDVPEFTVNLLSEDSASEHFMKIKLAVELVSASDNTAVEKLLPRLQDDWGTYLRQLRPSDMQGSAALYRLKEGLLRRANQSLAPVTVRAVYIRELLVQ